MVLDGDLDTADDGWASVVKNRNLHLLSHVPRIRYERASQVSSSARPMLNEKAPGYSPGAGVRLLAPPYELYPVPRSPLLGRVLFTIHTP